MLNEIGKAILQNAIVLVVQVVLRHVAKDPHDHRVFLQPGAHHVVQDALGGADELRLVESWAV